MFVLSLRTRTRSGLLEDRKDLENLRNAAKQRLRIDEAEILEHRFLAEVLCIYDVISAYYDRK